MKLLITGATGYIGQHLIRLGQAHGHEIIAASRAKPRFPNVQWIPFDLSDGSNFTVPLNTTAIIHLAANTSAEQSKNEEQEQQALRSILKSAHSARAKFIFVSSQTAHPQAATAYGRRKWNLERDALHAGGIVIRVGQVYGGEARGLFGNLLNIVSHSPILPAFFPAPQIQPIHIDDLAEALIRATTLDCSSEILHFGKIMPIPFTNFLRHIAKHRLRKFRIFLPIPKLAIVLLANTDPNLLRRQSWQRLTSLFTLQVMPTEKDLMRINMTLRPITSGMHVTGSDRRRALLLEARALLIYIFRTETSVWLLRRYARIIEALRSENTAVIPQFFIKYPRFLPLLERRSTNSFSQKLEFLWRLNAITLLAEASPQGATKFIEAPQKSSFLNSLRIISLAILSEFFWRVISALTAPFVLLMSSSSKKNMQRLEHK